MSHHIYIMANNPEAEGCKRQCRICLQEEDEYDNPPINPACSCKGSLQYIHEDCLIKEITSKYYWLTKRYDCSICHKVITAYTVKERHPLREILYNLLVRLVVTLALAGLIYWMADNYKRYAKMFFGYPHFKIYDSIVICLSVVAFLAFGHLLMFFKDGIYTGRRRVKFQEKAQ